MLPSPSLIYMLEFLQNKRWQEGGGEDPEERMLKGPGCGEGRRDDEGEKEERNGWGEMPRQWKWGVGGRLGWRGREFRRLLEEVQEGWERCREAESKEFGRCLGRFPEVQE